MVLRKVTLVGGNGTLGPHIINTLVSAGEFETSVLSRASSKATYASTIREVKVSDEMSKGELVTAFTGQDALIISIQVWTSLLNRMLDAAFEAGVKRVIPNDFGSCDSSDPRTLEVLEYYKGKVAVREHLQELARRSGGAFSWTSLVNGHFLDWGLKSTLMQIDLQKHTMRIFDGGDLRISATTLPHIGSATVKILQREEATRNQVLFVQSVSFTQNELLAVATRVTGRSFEVTHASSADHIRKYQEKLRLNEDDRDAREELVAAEGTVNANWEIRDGFANELLEMPEGNLEDIVKAALA